MTSAVRFIAGATETARICAHPKGFVGLIAQNVKFTETKKVVDIGPLHVSSDEQHNVPIPTIAGIAAVIAGLGMIFASRRYT